MKRRNKEQVKRDNLNSRLRKKGLPTISKEEETPLPDWIKQELEDDLYNMRSRSKDKKRC